MCVPAQTGKLSLDIKHLERELRSDMKELRSDMKVALDLQAFSVLHAAGMLLTARPKILQCCRSQPHIVRPQGESLQRQRSAVTTSEC